MTRLILLSSYCTFKKIRKSRKKTMHVMKRYYVLRCPLSITRTCPYSSAITGSAVARWQSIGLRSERSGGGVETYFRRVVCLSKTLYSPKVLVIPWKRWLRPDMTEKLLTGTLNLNTNKQTNRQSYHCSPDKYNVLAIATVSSL